MDWDSILESVSPEQRTEIEKKIRKYQELEAPVVRALNDMGIECQSIDEMRMTGIRYEKAIPVLLDALPKVADWKVKESIVRALSVPWASPLAIRPLLDEFYRSWHLHETLGQVFGNAMRVIVVDEFYGEICAIIMNKEYGYSRIPFVRSLWRMKKQKDKSPYFLQEMLSDEQLTAVAIEMIRKFNAKSAATLIAPYVSHKNFQIRQEAKKALKKFGCI